MRILLSHTSIAITCKVHDQIGYLLFVCFRTKNEETDINLSMRHISLSLLILIMYKLLLSLLVHRSIVILPMEGLFLQHVSSEKLGSLFCL